MLNLGLSEMMLIGVLLIVFVGPDRLPEVMRFLGRNYGKLRRASNDLRRAFQLEVDKVDAEARAREIRARREALAERRRAEREAREATQIEQGSADGAADPLHDLGGAAERPDPHPAPGAPSPGAAERDDDRDPFPRDPESFSPPDADAHENPGGAFDAEDRRE